MAFGKERRTHEFRRINTTHCICLGRSYRREIEGAVPGAVLGGDSRVRRKGCEGLFRKLLRGKIHGATVTGADLHYEGSIAIDTDLLAAAGIAPFESVQVWNVNNGARFETYTIASPSGSGEVLVNGAAARQAQVGDRVIIAAFGWLDEVEICRHTPAILLMDCANRVITDQRDPVAQRRIHFDRTLLHGTRQASNKDASCEVSLDVSNPNGVR